MSSEATDIPPGTYTLELGSTFSDSKRAEPVQYHTLRYDFKPKSVATADSDKYIAYGGNGDVHVAVPGEGENLTVYKGSKKEVKPKECLLFFDKNTGRVRLEKIASNVNVKKTRDLDQRTEQVLRNEISRLRTSSKPPAPEPASSSARDDSSSSSSSSGSDSDSDDDGSARSKRRDSNSSMSDMESQLLASVNAAPPQPPPPSTRDDLFMPDLSSSFNQPPKFMNRSAPPKNDDLGLNLSESSDEDD